MPILDIAAAPAPATIGPYRILREIGRGGMGFVYEAVHEQLQRHVAIKLLRWDLAAEPEQVARFVREGRAACNVRHPHVIEVYEFGQFQGAPYLVMDLVVGETLAESLRRSGSMPLPELLSIVLPVVSAVAAAHEAGVVHRDLKPGNIMLTTDRSGQVVPKVLDFGTSKLFGDNADLALTHSAAVIGTPYYMAPEQARASRNVDERCDQYSLGVIMYECATGVRPFEGDSIYDLMHAIMTAEVTSPSAITPQLPRAFDKIVRRAMSRDPAERFASVSALGAALLELAGPNTRRMWAEDFKRSSERRESAAHADARAVARSASNSRLPSDARSDSAQLRQRARRRWTFAVVGALLVALSFLAWRLSSIEPVATQPTAAAGTAPGANPTPSAAVAAQPSAAPPAAEPAPHVSAEAPEAAPAEPTNTTARTAARSSAAPEHERPRPAPAVRSAKPQSAKADRESNERRARTRHGQASSPVGWGDNGAPIIE